MVHRGGRALVYHGKAPVAVVGVKPDRSSREPLGPIILRATDGDVRIGRMHRDALKLSSSQGGIVLSQPGVASINRFPDAAIITAINNIGIGRSHLDHVTIRVRGIIVVSEGGSSAVKGSGLLFCASGTPNIAAQEKLVGTSGSARHDVKGDVVETLAGAKAAATRQLGRPGGATVVGPAESAKTCGAITKRRAGRDIGRLAAGHVDFRYAGARISPQLSPAIGRGGGGGDKSLGERRRCRHRIRGPIDAAIARYVNPIQPCDDRVAGRILGIEHHVVDAAIDRAGKIETETLARIRRANRETRAGDPGGWTRHIRESRQSPHGRRRNAATEGRISSQADDATGGADEQSVGVARHPQNLADRAACEEARAPRCHTVCVDVVSDRINGTDESRCRVDVFDPVETDADVAIRRAIRFAGADPEPAVNRIQVERTDGQRLRGVEDWRPGHAAIERAVDPALSRADINLIGISRVDFNRRNSATHGNPGGLRLAQRDWIRSQFHPIRQSQRRLGATRFFHRPH
jgi:hypothetical protein